MSNSTDKWTVKHVLEHIPGLGIPHFQRGLVWGVESRAALLESLFFDTPCGSFVLWVPKDCEARGVPLDPAVCTGMKYLVIDGQQRIRSLHAVFNERAESDDESDDLDDPDDSKGGDRKTWCINLTRIQGYSERLRAPGRDLAMFVHTLDPALRQAAKQPSPLKYNMLPLRAIFAAESWSSDAMAPYRNLLQPDSKAGELTVETLESLYQTLRTTVLEMKERVFFVSVQYKDDLAEMANLYNRINAGGKRVEIEERAFARLVGLQPGTYDELARLFDAVHGAHAPTHAASVTGELPGRDEVLQRQKEKAFGFKLFIRVFLQVCQHHLGFRQGTSEFSFDLANKPYFLSEFRKLSAEQASRLWAETSRVLAQVRGLLMEELACDDLRSLPDTNGLTPVFQLLIHYPPLSEFKYRPLLASLCLRLMLAEIDSKTLLQLLHKASDPGRVAFDVIPEMLQVLERATDKAKLSTRLEQAKSIQHRYVLLLYWLERHRGARDFLYAKTPNPQLLTPPERRVEEAAEPEKQHLLPFKKAQALYPGDLRRGGSHIVNSIGNLTYISRELNGFDRGLGDAFADLAAEPEDNLRAHLLVDERPERRVLREYTALRDRLAKGDPTPSGKDREIFERMARHRRELIHEGFRGWLAEIDMAAAGALGLPNLSELSSLARSEGRIEPVAPEFAPLKSMNVAHVIRKLGLDHEDEDRVVHLAKKAVQVQSRKSDPLKRDLWLTKRQKLVWVKARPGRVMLCFRADVAQEFRRQIVAALGLAGDGQAVADEMPLAPVPDFQTLLTLMETLRPEIEQQAVSAVVSKVAQ